MPRDIYSETTDRIVELLEKGIVPWQRPWDKDKCQGPAAPRNAATGTLYHGINVLLLGMHPAAFISGDPRFCTYKQAADRGWQVRKSEKSTPVVFYKPLAVDNEKYDPAKEDSSAMKLIGLLRLFSVFHVSQIDGVPPFVAPTLEEAPWQRPDAAEIILKNSGAVVTIGGDQAFYSPHTDHINLPPDHAFKDERAWASVAMHEAIHWTGGEKRLARDQTGRKGSKAYSFEELIAETGSLFVGSILNIPSEIENSASYIGHWLEILKEDKRAIFRASALAQKAADYLLAFHPEYKPEAAPEVPPQIADMPRPVQRPEPLTV